MLKNTTTKERFQLLKEWIPVIIGAIKKDLKNEHLKNDPRFAKKYFTNKQLSKITPEELALGYAQALELEENSEGLAEYLSNRWLLKNADVYSFFEERLHAISPQFTDLEELEKHHSISLMDDSISKFGAPNTYLFCVINSVVFPAEIYGILKKRAAESKHSEEKEEQIQQEQMSLEKLHSSYQAQIARQADKYEKKIAGLERKYLSDTDSLKKQIANLQRKLNG